ncbi:MAG TPA: oligosaccharide flippase family protein [Candidatus Saccharimonadales bacterium]|nr:oligosaccharide flippase family protein [Candidatus Saccharimonadales bacterium]
MKEKAIHYTKKILTHELVSGSSVLFIGTMVANVFAFLFNLFVVRKISYSAYGEYSALISLFTLATIPAQSLSPVIVRFASSYLAKKEEGKASGFYLHMLSFLSIVAIFMFVGFLLGNGYLKQFLHIANTGYIVLVGTIVAVSYISIVNSAFLQSLLKFGFISVVTSLGSIIKLTVGVILVLLGYQVGGILWAILLSLLVGFILGFYPLKRFIFNTHTDRTIALKEIIVYALPTLVAFFALSSFTSTDVLLVKHFFSGDNAGLYSGLSLVGRVIFYFTAPITAVMFPLVIKRHEEKRNFHSLFFVATSLVLLPSVAITVFYFLFPTIAVSILLGGKGYVAIAPYIGWYGIFLCLFSILNVFVNFFLSLKHTEVVILVGLGALSQAIGISLFHTNFASVIEVSIITSFGLLLLLLLYYYKLYALSKKTS